MQQSQSFALKRVKEVLWVLAVSFVVVGTARMITGLGASSYMSDAIPWGLWKIFNMVAGAALATGGFVVACVIYVFQLEKYRPLARVAIVVAFLGYGASLTALLFDIGLPWRGWHPFFMWNYHSFLFEVFWCVSCYWGVTAFEMLPIVFERLPWPKVTHFLHEIALPIIVIGITLSTMHHSSLGSLFMTSPTRLHPLWFSTWIPIEFFTSAMGSGMAGIILVVIVVSWLYNRSLNMPVLTGMAKACAGMLMVYFGIRAVDFTVHDKWQYVFGPDVTWESWVFMVEIMLQVILPVLIIAVPALRTSRGGLLAAASSAVLGLSMHRIDVGIVGYFRTAGEVYFPSLGEWLLSLGVISAAALVFLFLVERFYVLEAPDDCESPEAEGAHADMARQWTLEEFISIATSPGAMRVAVIIMVSIPLAMFAVRNQALSPFKPELQPVRAPLGLESETIKRADLRIDGNRRDEFVIFPHKIHQEEHDFYEEQCRVCHHLSLPNDQATQCFHCHQDMNLPTDMFDHEAHQERHGGKDSCVECHDLDEPKGKLNSPKCIKCHEENMPGLTDYAPDKFTHMASGYKDAMHGVCITCHRRYGEELECMHEAECVGNCKNCHPDPARRETAMSR
jgi:Ni/Fe-hydrogenase subunit HybB-like protein